MIDVGDNRGYSNHPSSRFASQTQRILSIGAAKTTTLLAKCLTWRAFFGHGLAKKDRQCHCKDPKMINTKEIHLLIMCQGYVIVSVCPYVCLYVYLFVCEQRNSKFMDMTKISPLNFLLRATVTTAVKKYLLFFLSPRWVLTEDFLFDAISTAFTPV